MLLNLLHFLRGASCYKLSLATVLLPNAFVPLLVSKDERFVNAGRGIGLHTGQDVRVKIERDAYLAVAQPLAGDFGMHAACQHVSRVRMTKVVKPNTGQVGLADQTDPLVSQASRLEWFPICLSDDKSVLRHPGAQPKQFLSLPAAMEPQFPDDSRG